MDNRDSPYTVSVHFLSQIAGWQWKLTFHQSQPLTQSYDVTHAVRVVKNVTCLSSLLLFCVCTTLKQIWEMSDHS
jgi:hypothetical protein